MSRKKQVYEKITALYCRISLDDGGDNESMSISNQKLMLRDFAEKHGMFQYEYYVDDGYTGRNFNRPSFQRMIADIEAGKIGCVITKDLSRLGRNYIEAGSYIEIFFPKHNVRYIAVTDGVDSLTRQEMDITPFKNILNDMYSRDISKKVLAGRMTRSRQGKFCGGQPPLGLMRDPEDKGHLILDPETAPVIRKIYDMALDGWGCMRIAKQLMDDKIPITRVKSNTECDVNYYSWGSARISHILRNPFYKGAHLVCRTHQKGIRSNTPDRDGRRLARHRRRRCGLRHQLRRAGGERVLYPPHRPHGPCPEKGHRRVHPRHVPGAGEAGGDREIFPLCHTAREIRGGRLPRRGGAAEAQKGAAAPPLPLTAAETGLLLLCCALPEAEDRPLTMPQFQELAKRARALGPGGENPLRELTARDLERLGYAPEQCGRIVRLLSRETQLERYLRAAERNGIVPITRLSPRYPARLRQTLGQRCPAVLFARGDETPLSMRCISVVGSRELTEGGRAFAEAAGRLIARSGYALCSGGAMGADRAAQEACLTACGSAVVFPAGRLLDCPAQAHVLYLAEQGYDLPFSAQRALSRNHFIHATGEKTLVAQCRAGAGGTWDGTTENLRRGWSPVFVSDDGSEGAQALIARGAVPVRTLSGLDDLQPAQLQF